jgi:hypothetical protein
MKGHLKHILGLAALGMTLLANTVPTWAGTVETREVSIKCDQNSCSASGGMVAARYSADRTQSIGCTLDSSPSVRCHAQDSAGKSFSCASTKREHAEAIQRMTDSSSLLLLAQRGSPVCSIIEIYNYSLGLQ